MSYITIDSSTSSTTVIVFNEKLEIIKRFQKEHRQIITDEGYIEHDLEEIYQNLIELVKKASEIISNPKFISLTNQRETFTLFNKKDGKPLHNAVVWQCTRGQKICQDILNDKLRKNEIIGKTGLKPNTFFSGSKLKWVYENKSDVKSKIDNGDILFGTIETYLIYRLTNLNSYVTDTTNASRTLLFNCLENSWDKNLLNIFDGNNLKLPKILNSSNIFGESDFNRAFKKLIPIIGVAGDAQATYFANFCFNKGDTKITTGTGFNIQTNVGNKMVIDENSLTSLAFTEGRENFYALECLNSFAGGTISWLKNNLKLICEAQDSEVLSKKESDNNGVYLVPAFSGLGPPFWKSNARAAFFGISASTNTNHLVRAGLESVAYQMVVYLEFMKKSQNLDLKDLTIDGGMIKNKFFLQIISDLLEVELIIPKMEDMSSYGALLFGIKYYYNIKNNHDLREFKLRNFKIIPNKNVSISNSYNAWKAIVDKHFIKNQG